MKFILLLYSLFYTLWSFSGPKEAYFLRLGMFGEVYHVAGAMMLNPDSVVEIENLPTIKNEDGSIRVITLDEREEYKLLKHAEIADFEKEISLMKERIENFLNSYELPKSKIKNFLINIEIKSKNEVSDWLGSLGIKEEKFFLGFKELQGEFFKKVFAVKNAQSQIDGVNITLSFYHYFKSLGLENRVLKGVSRRELDDVLLTGLRKSTHHIQNAAMTLNQDDFENFQQSFFGEYEDESIKKFTEQKIGNLVGELENTSILWVRVAQEGFTDYRNLREDVALAILRGKIKKGENVILLGSKLPEDWVNVKSFADQNKSKIKNLTSLHRDQFFENPKKSINRQLNFLSYLQKNGLKEQVGMMSGAMDGPIFSSKLKSIVLKAPDYLVPTQKPYGRMSNMYRYLENVEFITTDSYINSRELPYKWKGPCGELVGSSSPPAKQ